MNILISSVYDISESIILGARNNEIEKIYLLRQKDDKDSKIEDTISKIKKKFSVKVSIVSDVYDIYFVAKTIVDLIDSIPSENKIYVNVTHGRKLLALGILFGSYARQGRIKEIFYITEENHSEVILPKLDFDLTDSERLVLENLKIINENNEKLIITEFSRKIDLSRAMVYRVFMELENRGYIKEDENNKYILTDAGRIVLL